MDRILNDMEKKFDGVKDSLQSALLNQRIILAIILLEIVFFTYLFVKA